MFSKKIFSLLLILLLITTLLFSIHLKVEDNTKEEKRVRAREMGVAVGILPPGNNNAITDVPGVKVGHSTVIEGDDIRTGITAVLPHAGNLYQEEVPGAIYLGNAFGKLAGYTQVEEMGSIETPILLTGNFVSHY